MILARVWFDDQFPAEDEWYVYDDVKSCEEIVASIVFTGVGTGKNQLTSAPRQIGVQIAGGHPNYFRVREDHKRSYVRQKLVSAEDDK